MCRNLSLQKCLPTRKDAVNLEVGVVDNLQIAVLEDAEKDRRNFHTHTQRKRGSKVAIGVGRQNKVTPCVGAYTCRQHTVKV